MGDETMALWEISTNPLGRPKRRGYKPIMSKGRVQRGYKPRMNKGQVRQQGWQGREKCMHVTVVSNKDTTQDIVQL